MTAADKNSRVHAHARGEAGGICNGEDSGDRRQGREGRGRDQRTVRGEGNVALLHSTEHLDVARSSRGRRPPTALSLPSSTALTPHRTMSDALVVVVVMWCGGA